MSSEKQKVVVVFYPTSLISEELVKQMLAFARLLLKTEEGGKALNEWFGLVLHGSSYRVATLSDKTEAAITLAKSVAKASFELTEVSWNEANPGTRVPDATRMVAKMLLTSGGGSVSIRPHQAVVVSEDAPFVSK